MLQSTIKSLFTAVLLCWASVSFGLAETVRAAEPKDVIARVGDETITFSQLNTMMNSAPVVGLSLPALGTPQRNQAMIVLLDKAVSANLIYLDARAKGADKDPEYVRDIARFERGVLAGRYRSRYLVGDIPVSDEEVESYFNSSITAGTELTPELRQAIEAKLRKQKYSARAGARHERLREGADISVVEAVLVSSNDAKRTDADVIARVDGEEITWGEVKERMRGASQRSELMPMTLSATEERRKMLDAVIDERLMAAKARAAGLEEDAVYKGRVAEFRKTRLINLHRQRLVRSMQPSDEEISAYYREHRDRISSPESRKLQMVVLRDRHEAEQLKRRIDGGELTFHEAAVQYSIDPRASNTFGEMGWVKKGTGFPDLDELTFSLGPGTVGGPVQTPAGWHLVRVLDVRDPMYQSLDDDNTRGVVRRELIRERLDRYTADLRRNSFRVVVYEDVLNELFRQEAEWIEAKTREAEKHPERIREVLDEIKSLGGK